MAFFYLVRHGQTDLIGKMLCGVLPGIHLNEKGRLQAQKAADFFDHLQIKAVYTSPIERASETAAAIAERVKLESIWVDFLKEIDFGELQSIFETDLKRHSVWQHFLQNPAEVVFPGGESVNEAQNRVVAGLDALAAQFAKEDRVVCVGHCEILRLAVCHAIHLSPDHFHNLTIDPASVSLLEWSNERKKLRLLNLQPE